MIKMKDLPNKVLILDTEFVNGYLYDMGFIIAEKQESGFYKEIEKHQFLIEQVYHNSMLFDSVGGRAKRKKYISLLRGRKATLSKFGYITQMIPSILKRHDITQVIAYNCSADKTILIKNCETFKIKNPFENVEWLDLMSIANHYIHLKIDYINFAIENEFIGTSGYVETTAETTYAFMTNNKDYQEEHTSLEDCKIELEILNRAIENGYTELKTLKTMKIKSDSLQTLTILHNGIETKFDYLERRNETKKNRIVLKL